ncbi:MAG: hypothetical protein GXO90_04255 [FCB group bacterium]|nr:hypothetical protein [FCB group bacterium]
MLTLVFGQSDRSLKYFLTETDILSDHSVPKIEVRHKAHWEGRFDEQGRPLSLESYDRDDQLILRRKYRYDDNGNLETRDEYNREDKLTSRMSMGLDEDALRFVKYLYGVDQVLSWGDRFTIRRYTLDGIPFETTFYEADGMPYGKIEDVRDSAGNTRYTIWTRLPEREVIRRWEYIYSSNGGHTLKQYDRSGKLIEFKTYNSQEQRVIIQIAPPDSNRRLNRIELSYRLSDTLRTAGAVLSDSSGLILNRYPITGNGLLPGQHRIILDENPVLDDDNMYSIRMEGETLHEGDCQPDSAQGYRFDTHPPILRLKIDSLVSVPTMMFTTNEPLQEATVVWMPDSTTVLSPTPRLIPLTRAELLMGDSAGFLPQFAENLNEEGTYRVSLLARDFAGNLGKSPAIQTIRFDPTPPEIRIEAPESQAIANNPFLRFSTSEDLAVLTAWISTTSGRFRYDLSDQSTAGKHVWRIPESIIETVDKIQRIALLGMDVAGNSADTALVRNIRFDFDMPVLTVIYPQSHSFIKDGNLSIIANEALEIFKVNWQSISDDTVVFKITISNVMNRPGEKTLLDPPIERKLVLGNFYNLEVMGLDSAGNPSTWVTIDSLEYDPVSPELLITQPEYGAEMDTLKVAFEISEVLSVGWLYLQKLEAAESDTMIFRLPDSLLSTGPHLYYPLFQAGREQFGEYKLWLIGEDKAGNVSEAARVNKIRLLSSDVP